MPVNVDDRIQERASPSLTALEILGWVEFPMVAHGPGVEAAHQSHRSARAVDSGGLGRGARNGPAARLERAQPNRHTGSVWGAQTSPAWVGDILRAKLTVDWLQP